MQFAEFLNHSSPNRLGILYLPTCVGLGYGHHENSLADFLDSMGSITSPVAVRHHVSGLLGSGLTYAPPYTLTPGLPSPGLIYPSVSPLRWRPWYGSVRPALERTGIPLAIPVLPWRAHGGTGISTGCPSTTPLGLALGPDLPWED